jgi:sigma-B regulation protein RsbU (phosphoserine phosphatase)
VAARLDPAEGVLAGDWYDAVALNPSCLALVLGDVAGHGPASAVFALRLKHSLLTALRAGLDPGRALTQVSTELAELSPGQFATVLVATLDTTTGSLAYANAGHPAGLLLDGPAAGERGRADAPSPRRVESDQPVHWLELPSTGPLLSSIVSGWAWNTATRPFRPGDALLAVTDGVLETRDEHGREFGAEGILKTVAEAGSADGDRLIAAIAAASMRFGGNRPRRDDHTLVYVRRVTAESTEPAATVQARIT